MLTASALLLLMLGPGIGAVPSRLWEHQGSSRCVMRMPNLLGHESPAEAVQQSTSWLLLLARECHPHAPLNSLSSLCLCLFRIISPCRSLCASVQDSCAPIMNCYSYPWPRILQCDQFPKDHLMFLQRNVDGNNAGFSLCTDCELEEATSSKDLLDLFCKSDFGKKLHLSKLNSRSSVLTMFSLGSRLEVLKHGPLLGEEMSRRLTLWRDATCVGNLTRNHPDRGDFLLTGTVLGKRLLVTKALSWGKRQRHLSQAARKWKSHRCRG
uniref:FZ domain-containing protein n=1 Tax=Sinocyclocheilus grahami TaxID=75366 RepID=A0A672TC97_SINGR